LGTEEIVTKIDGETILFLTNMNERVKTKRGLQFHTGMYPLKAGEYFGYKISQHCARIELILEG